MSRIHFRAPTLFVHPDLWAPRLLEYLLVDLPMYCLLGSVLNIPEKTYSKPKQELHWKAHEGVWELTETLPSWLLA